MATELKDCPFCGCAATFVKHSAGMKGTQGFDKWDAVACKHCRATIGACDRRFREQDDAANAWNKRISTLSKDMQRAALAASGGNAAPPDACPVAITDSSALNGIKWYVKPPEWLADGMNLYFVPAKIVPASGPNAALVAITEEQLVKAARYLSDFQCDQTGVNKDDAWNIYGSSDIELLRAALSAAGQEVGK